MTFDDFVDLLHAIVEGNLVWEVRGEHEWFGADALDGIGERLLIAFAADEQFAAGKIIHGLALNTQAAILQLSFQAIDNHGNPTRATLEKPDAQAGELVEHAIDDHAGGGDGEGNRHAERSRSRKYGVSVETEIAVAAAVHGQCAVELCGFFIHRPKMFRAEMWRQAIRR